MIKSDDFKREKEGETIDKEIPIQEA